MISRTEAWRRCAAGVLAKHYPDAVLDEPSPSPAPAPINGKSKAGRRKPRARASAGRR